MRIDHHVHGAIAVVRLAGNIAVDQGADTILRVELRRLLEAGHRFLLLDMGGVDHVDSEGLGELAQAYVSARNRGGTLKLHSVTRRVRTLLVVTKLITVFETFDSEQDALASFEAPPTGLA